MEKRINYNSGFSLIELLVGLAISCIVLIAAYSFVIAGINSYDTTRKTTEIQQEAQFVENIIVDAVENGAYESSTIDEDSVAVKFNTGKKVIYHDKANNILALYDASSPDIGDLTKIDSYVISKNVTVFRVAYINTELVTDAFNNYVEEVQVSPGATAVTPTELVKVEVTIEKKGKTDSSVKQYKFRNK